MFIRIGIIFIFLLLAGSPLALRSEPVKKTDELRDKASAGDMEAAFYLGNEYYYGENRVRNYTLAAYWFHKAAEKGITEAQYNYACCLESGYGVKADLSEAFSWYKKAADRNFAPALFRIAKFYATGIPEKNGGFLLMPDPPNALKILEKLAAEQFPPAEVELAAYRMGKNSSDEDHRQAFHLLVRVTGRGDCPPEAERMLADCYYSGIGCRKDRDKAVRLLKSAAGKNEPEALAKLGFLYEYGNTVRADAALSKEYYRKAAEAGHPMAQFKYAEALSEGVYAGKNLNDALPWYRKSAETGCVQAQFKLGVLYLEGTGVKPDKRRAVHYFYLAARSGFVRAQYNLACLFDDGTVNGKPDREAAFYWFQQAARNGDAAAQRRVAECYLNGIGVDRSITQAEKWLLMAAQNGDISARELLFRIQRAARGGSYY